MNSLDKIFATKKENLLAVYFTAGFPLKNSMDEIITSLNESDTDIIEIGIPFSDPMADGEVIQHSSKIALENGMNINLLFAQLSHIKSKCPLVIMTYFNPVYKYGFEKFGALCQKNNISGLIIPDLPLIEYENNYKYLYEKYDLKFIPLVSPTTSNDRIQKLCEAATGFVYMVSNSQITGEKGQGTRDKGQESREERQEYVKRILNFSNGKPVLMGFGINSRQKFQNACEIVHGAIIGSAYIQLLEQNKNNSTKATKEFVSNIKSKAYDHSITK